MGLLVKWLPLNRPRMNEGASADPGPHHRVNTCCFPVEGLGCSLAEILQCSVLPLTCMLAGSVDLGDRAKEGLRVTRMCKQADARSTREVVGETELPLDSWG